jgi:hypothetical protein
LSLLPLEQPTRCNYGRRMDQFADFEKNFVLALIAVLLLMAIWSCAVLAIDHWVGLGHSPK